ncbi:MAG: hypothetical protein IH971_08445 [Candidatus Marinimicrobia bacterium]|nr:hypothetical protein [Candidatus Neomarinimicrobiota bacterium]
MPPPGKPRPSPSGLGIAGTAPAPEQGSPTVRPPIFIGGAGRSAPTLRQLLDWLDEEQGVEEIVGRYQSGGVSLDPSRLGEWRRELPADEVAAFHAIAGDTLARFDYSD